MVVGLQLPFNSLPLAGAPGRHLPMESETIEPLSFGEILKLKEKQLQGEQLVSSSSIAAALVSLQTQTLALPVLLPAIQTNELEIDSSLDGSSQPAIDATVEATTSSATQPATARLNPTAVSDPVVQAFSNIQAEDTPQQIELPRPQAAQAQSIDTAKSVVRTFARLETADNTVNMVSEPRATRDTAQVVVNRSEQGRASVQMKTPALSTPVQARTEPTTATGIQQPIGNPGSRSDTKINSRAQTTFTSFNPQSSESTAPLQDDTVSSFTISTGVSAAASRTMQPKNGVVINTVPADPVPVHRESHLVQNQPLTMDTVPHQLEHSSGAKAEQLEPPVSISSQVSLSPGIAEQSMPQMRTRQPLIIATPPLGDTEIQQREPMVDVNTKAVQYDKAAPSISSRTMIVESAKPQNVVPLDESAKQRQTVDSNSDTSITFSDTFIGGRTMALSPDQSETTPLPTALEGPEVEANILVDTKHKGNQPPLAFSTSSDGVPFPAQSETVQIMQMAEAQSPVQEVEDVAVLLPDSESEPVVGPGSKSDKTQQPTSASSYESQAPLPDAVDLREARAGIQPVMHEQVSTVAVGNRDLPEYSTSINRIPQAAQGEVEIGGLDSGDTTSDATSVGIQNTEQVRSSVKPATVSTDSTVQPSAKASASPEFDLEAAFMDAPTSVGRSATVEQAAEQKNSVSNISTETRAEPDVISTTHLDRTVRTNTDPQMARSEADHGEHALQSEERAASTLKVPEKMANSENATTPSVLGGREVSLHTTEIPVLDKTKLVSLDVGAELFTGKTESDGLRIDTDDMVADFSATTTKELPPNLIFESSPTNQVSKIETSPRESYRATDDLLSSEQPADDVQFRRTQSQKLNVHAKDVIDAFEPSKLETGTVPAKVADENPSIGVPEVAPELRVASAETGEAQVPAPSTNIDVKSAATQQSEPLQAEAVKAETDVSPNSRKIDVASSGSGSIDAHPNGPKVMDSKVDLAPSTDDTESIETHSAQAKSVKPSIDLDAQSAKTVTKVVEPKDQDKLAQEDQMIDAFDASVDGTTRKHTLPMDVKVVVPQPVSSEASAKRNFLENESAAFEQVLDHHVQSLDDAVDVKVADPDFVAAELNQGSSTDQSATPGTSRPVDEVNVPSKPVIDSHVAKSPAVGIAPANVEPKENPLGGENTSTTVGNVVQSTVPNKDAEVEMKPAQSQLNSAASQPEQKPVLVDDLVAKTAQKSTVQTEPKEEIKIRQATFKDEETRPVEKRSEPNQMHISAVPTNGPVHEAVGAESNEKQPVGQVYAHAAEVADQVIRHMKANIKSGLTSMHMQLNPNDLGAIDVEMVSSARGVQVTFFAEQASTGRLLETQLNQLRDSLLDSGVQLSGLNIGQHNTQGQKGGAFSQDTNFASFSQRSFTESNVEAVPVVQKSIGQSSEVDYRI